MKNPHRRLNPLTGEWVLVSPHRALRPWQGQLEEQPSPEMAPYDPECYLCPRNTRAQGAQNPDYSDTFVFTNDFSALYPIQDLSTMNQDNADLLKAQSEPGVCRVMCFSSRHDLTLATMDVPAIRRVIDQWAEQRRELMEMAWIRYVQIFENRGAMMGASNPHPHCQIWASASIPDEPAKELRSQLAYLQKRSACLLCEYLKLELKNKDKSRIVFENASFVVLVPFWAIWPFELMIISKNHGPDLLALTPAERDALAEVLKKTTAAYNRLFNSPFPYSMGFHEAPTDKNKHPEWHLHGHFYPPLLRSATIRKFMVGYELLGGPQRDITPESAAAMLQEQFTS